MKNKYLAYALVLPVLGLIAVGATSAASAKGPFGSFMVMHSISPDEIVANHEQMFSHQATLLGVDVQVVKNGWAEGKSLFEIAEANGISAETLQAKMKEMHLTEVKSQLQTLVDRGVITQAQADTRLAAMESFEGKKGTFKVNIKGSGEGVRMMHGPMTMGF